MILLLVGLLCFAGALRVARNGVAAAGDDVRPAGAAAWMALLALLVLAQLAAGRGALDGYRVTLLGFRLELAPEGAGGAEPTVGGDYETADLWVPGAGTAVVARLRRDTTGSVRVLPEDDAGAVTLVEESGILRTRWRVLGARVVTTSDTVTVGTGDEALRLVTSTVADTLYVAGRAVPVPWVREHVIRRTDARHPVHAGTGSAPTGDGSGGPGGARAGDVPGAVSGAARLPGVERGLLARLWPYHPSVFQRTYPLSDVLAAVDARVGARLAALSSFFFYRDGRLHLADLDSEVALSGPSHRPGRREDRGDGEPVGNGVRLLVAGLPLRDYPEPDLTLPERYGVRPLRSFRVVAEGRWLDAGLTSPETRVMDRDALEDLRLPGSRNAEGEPVYRLRLASARQALARKAVVFDAAPARFEVPGQAVLSLPLEPTRGSVEILTPSGLTEWETGRPLALGTGQRRLLVRVDGQGTSAGFWWIHVVLLALPVALVLLRPATGPVFALALAAAGLGAFRLVLSLSAMAEPPHVMEAWQLGLWLFPYLPWVVVVAGEVARGVGRSVPAGRRSAPSGMPEERGAYGSSGRERTAWRAPADPGESWIRRGFHGAYALVLVGLAAVLFPASGAKAAALSVLALATAGTWWAGRAGVLDPHAAWRGVHALVERERRWLRGWSLGLALLAARVVLELLGFREQVTVAGTRIGVSVFYTPVVVGALAFILARSAQRLKRNEGSVDFPAVVARTLVDVGAFLLLALVGVSGWISDFGIALVLLPGALALLALFGLRWAPRGRAGTLTVATLALPLLLLALVQAAPPLLRVAWSGDVQAEDARLGGLGEWHRNELLLLERGDPAALAMIGQRRSEALAVMRETMRSYTRGNVLGKGFLRGRVSEPVAETSTREHAVSALLASQFGLPGTAGLVLVLLALLPPGLELLLAGRDRRSAGGGGHRVLRAGGLLGSGLAVLVAAAYLLPTPFNTLLVGLAVAAAVAGLVAPAVGRKGAWAGAGVGGTQPRGEVPVAAPSALFRRLLASSALLTLAGAGLYMVLANYGLVLFTGKNVYLLGLDSLGDVLEAVALLGVAALALGAEGWSDGKREGARSRPEDRPRALDVAGGAWGRPPDRRWDGDDDGSERTGGRP